LTPASDRPTKVEHLGFVLAIGGFIGWYLWNSAAASAAFENLLLIGPVSVAGIVLVLFIFVKTLLARDPANDEAGGIPSRLPVGRTRDAIAVIVAFVVFVAALQFAGFDIATFVFMAAVLMYLGERRIAWIIGLSLGVSVALTAGALATLTYPLPTAILGRLLGLQ
jgi:hypothetical protein